MRLLADENFNSDVAPLAAPTATVQVADLLPGTPPHYEAHHQD